MVQASTLARDLCKPENAGTAPIVAGQKVIVTFERARYDGVVKIQSSRVLCAVVAMCMGVLSARAGEGKVVSKYTSTARAKSLSYNEHGEEGDPGFSAVCAGLGGYKLEFLGGDERSWINIRFGKQSVDLYSDTMSAGGGTFPHKANDVVEWRGVERNGRFVPFAIIYRIEAGNDETRKTHSRLLVIKLDRERSAVLGHTQGPHEEAEARATADRARPRSADWKK